jgi:tellurite resistance protein TerC
MKNNARKYLYGQRFLIFNGLLWFYLYLTTETAIANEAALDYFTGYLLEKSLSIDNLFAFYMVFAQFHIPIASQQRVFSYGIWSAIVFRLLVIVFCFWLVKHFYWALYLMGAFLLLTGIMLLLKSHAEKDLSGSRTLRWLKYFMRITDKLHGQRFFVRKKGLLYATPLFVALILIEMSDIVFAFDSIPAIFAITNDPFIIWSSNIFAILGLRAMYFLLVDLVERLYLLKYGMALILIFVGCKMIIAPWYHISVGVSLGMITAILLIFSLLSGLRRPT